MVMRKIRNIRLRIDQPCPCGSNKTIESCHLDFDGRFRKQLPRLTPPPPITGYSQPNCYLNVTKDCSQKISREHYISKTVLDQLGAMLRISGVPWLRPEQTFDTTTQNLTSKILCKRHNEALAPLDTEAGLFFSTITNALLDLNRKTLSRKPIFHLIGGDAVQLWLLKAACGIYFSIASKDRETIKGKFSIDLEKVQRAFFQGQWDVNAGLYFVGTTGDVVTTAHTVGIAPLTMDNPRQFGGARLSLNGFNLEVLFDTKGNNLPPWPGRIKRPSQLVFAKGEREHHIILTWPPGTPEASVRLDEKTQALRK
jgi:hypothetical protein